MVFIGHFFRLVVDLVVLFQMHHEQRGAFSFASSKNRSTHFDLQLFFEQVALGTKMRACTVSELVRISTAIQKHGKPF